MASSIWSRLANRNPSSSSSFKSTTNEPLLAPKPTSILSTIWQYMSDPIPWFIGFLILAPVTLSRHPSDYYMIMAIWFSAYVMATNKVMHCVAEDRERGWEGRWTRRYVNIAWVIAGVGTLGHVVDVGLLVVASKEGSGSHKGLRIAMMVCTLFNLGLHVGMFWKKRRSGDMKPYLFLWDEVFN